MTDCRNGEMRDLLPDLLHGRLAPARRVEVEAHVASCADCREELALLGLVRGAMRVPAMDVKAIVAALPAYRAPVQRPWGGLRAAAAVAAIAVGGATWAIATNEAPVAAGSVAAVSAPIVAPRDSLPASLPAPVATAPPRAGQAAVPRELAVAGAVSDLSDTELTALLAGLESLDAMPAATVSEDASLGPAVDVTPTRGAS